MSLMENIFLYGMGAVLTLITTILTVLFSRNLKAQSDQKAAVVELAKNVSVLANSLTNFQMNCGKIETVNTTRLNKHADELDHISIKVGQHDIRLDDHNRRIGNLEHIKEREK